MVKHAIFHEGKTGKSVDNSLVEQLINHLGLEIQQIRFYGMGSKSNFFKEYHHNYKDFIQQIRVDQIDKSLFILDADSDRSDAIYGGFDNTEREIKKVFDSFNITDLSDIYISCDPETKEGYLESLILSSIPSSHKACIENFLECSNFQSKDNAKAVLNQIYKQAYPESPYDFSHENFNELKDKITRLFL